MVTRVEDWHNNKIQSQSTNNLKTIFRKTDEESLSNQQFMKMTKNASENDKPSQSVTARAPIVNTSMIDQILKQIPLYNEDSKNSFVKKMKLGSSSTYEIQSSKYNEEILENLIKQRVASQAIVNAFTKKVEKKYILSQANIKDVGNNLKNKFKCTGANCSIKIQDLYQKVESEVQGHMTKMIEKKFDSGTLVKQNHTKRQLIEDFNKRYQIYRQFHLKETSKNQLNQEINKKMIEKVRIQKVFKDAVETMEKQDGIKYKNVLRFQKNLARASMNNFDNLNSFKPARALATDNRLPNDSMLRNSDNTDVKHYKWSNIINTQKSDENLVDQKLQELTIKYKHSKNEKKK